MAKYCGKCGQELNKDTGLCPKCNDELEIKKKKRINKKLIIIPVAVLLVFAIVFTGLNLFGVVRFSVSNNQTKSVSSDDFGRVEFKDFTDDDVVFEDGELFVKNQLLITADKKYSYSDVEEAVKNHGGEIVGSVEFTNDYQVEFSEITLNELNSKKSNLSAELLNSEIVLHNAYHVDDNETENDNDYSTKEGNWWRNAINLLDLEKEGLEYQEVKIGVYDTLFDTKNKDLSYAIKPDNIWYNNEPEVYVAESGEHGTNVCGFLASEKDNGYGINGVANNLEIYGYAYRGKNHSFGSLMEDKYFFVKMICKGVQVINISAGHSELQVASQQDVMNAKKDLESISNQLSTFYNKFINVGYEFVIVKSAGNENGYTWIKCESSKDHPYGIKSYDSEKDGKLENCQQLNRVIYTADYDYLGAINDNKVRNRIIIVGSSTKQNKRAMHSVSGQRVDIYAPGEDVTELTTGENGSGTSYAAPMVAGVVSLMWGINPGIYSDHIKYLLTSHATKHIDGEEYKFMGLGGEEEIEYKYLLDAKASVLMARTFRTYSKKDLSGKSYVIGSVRIVNNNLINFYEGKCKLCIYKGDEQNPIAEKVGELYKEGVTDNNGDFLFEIEPGFYYISAESEDGKYTTNNEYGFWVKESEVTYINDIYLRNKRSKNSGFINNNYLVEYNDVIYGVDETGLWKIESGCNKDYIAKCIATNIATDGHKIYFTTLKNAVERYYEGSTTPFSSEYQYELKEYDLDTGTGQAVLLLNSCAKPICAVGDTIYYTDYSDDTKNNPQAQAQGLCSYNMSTGEKKYIADGAHIVQSYDGKIFYRDVMAAVPSGKTHQIYCYDTATGKSEMISDGGVMGFKVLSGKVYYNILNQQSSGKTIKICSYDISSGNTDVLVEKTADSIDVQDYDEDYAIYSTGKMDEIAFFRVDLASGNEEKIPTSAFGGDHPHKAMRDSNRTVFYTDFSGGRVHTMEDNSLSVKSTTGSYSWQSLLMLKEDVAFSIPKDSNNAYKYSINCTKLSFADASQQNETTTESKTREYTAVELASMSLDEIKAIMGGDFESNRLQLSNAFSSDGCQYVYNNSVLPGFAFATNNDGYYGISIMNGAKLNNRISSDMTYTQIADIIGDMDGGMAGQGSGPVCSTTVDGYSVTFCFMDNDYLRQHRSGGQVSSDLLRQGNPVLQSIGLRKNR